MNSLYSYYTELQNDLWLYYNNLPDDRQPLKNPFLTCTQEDFRSFIENYFRKAGKSQLFQNTGVQVNELRYPEHICSVFFMGILFCSKIPFLSKKFEFKENPPGYDFFPFIWFLITLFHDNAYHYEKNTEFSKQINSIETLYKHFNIEHILFDKKNHTNKSKSIQSLLSIREKYFVYRRYDRSSCIDHGLLGGVLLYDRLIKIRISKKKNRNNDLYWGKELEKQYQLASEAISIHNIWILDNTSNKDADLKVIEKGTFKPIKYKNFPLFYLLGCIDTLEPLKKLPEVNKAPNEIISFLDNILIEFGEDYVILIEKEHNGLNILHDIFENKPFDNWLKVDVQDLNFNKYKISFS